MVNLQVSRSLQDRPIKGVITASPGATAANNTSIHDKDKILVSSDALSLEGKNEKEIVEHPDVITQDAQIGVQKAEAAALVWSRKAVYATYAWIWVCWFILALQSSISSNMIYYAYADFASAPQITQAFVVSIIVGGVLQLPIAKTLNLWGRAEGYVVFLAIMIIGLIVIASCSGPSSFAAGYTLYQVGYSSTGFILNIFVADTSGLRNRAFAYSFAATPFICTAYVGSLAAESFLKTATWRWSYGAFAIIIFVTLAPVAVIFKYYQRKAEKMGLFVRFKSGRTVTQSIIHYFHEFDIIGGLLLIAAFTLFLLSFTLQQYGYNGYKSATFICMLVIGIILLPVFAVWEKYFAKSHFIQYELFKNRTVLGASVLAAVIFFNFYTWDSYFYYYIQIVFNLSTSKTGYVTQVYNVIQPFWAVVFGIWIRQTRYFKNVTLYFGAPLIMLGSGLMIYFRGDESKLGFVIMCQVFIAVGGATLIIGDEMAVMAAADRDGVPMMLAILGIWSSLGGAIGYSVASAIYTNTFPQALLSRLPVDAQAEFSNIYLGGSATQLLYPPGTATRDAIDYAWAHSQKYLCITAAVVMVLAFPSIAVWKNYNVDKKQVKGTVI